MCGDKFILAEIELGKRPLENSQLRRLKHGGRRNDRLHRYRAAGGRLLSGPAITVGLLSNCGLPNWVASVPTRSTGTMAFSMNCFPCFFGSLQRCGQVEWHVAQFSANSCCPSAAFA